MTNLRNRYFRILTHCVVVQKDTKLNSAFSRNFCRKTEKGSKKSWDAFSFINKHSLGCFILSSFAKWLWLEHNSFKNVLSKGPAFLWISQIQTIEYGLNHTIWIKKQSYSILMLYSFIPSDMDFQTILMPKVILTKLCQRKAGPSEPVLFIML